MNNRQALVLITGLVLGLLLGHFPPRVMKGIPDERAPRGYLFSPSLYSQVIYDPVTNIGTSRRSYAIDRERLLIEINPEHAGAYASRGCVYNLKGENEKAIADCTKAIELDPGLAEAYNNRGLAYFSEKEFSKANADLKRAESLGHKVNPEFMRILSKVLEQEE